ncbi:MAG: hypothetical protein COA43_05905 [Robiginitomaculum sp.]|nr:MAG: hypothetical protein COA43_05905 [Robiginitomaculum sp.]
MSKRRAHRTFSTDFKKQVVAQTYEPVASVSVVARRHDINNNQLFKWRDDPRYAVETDCFLPIEIDAAHVDKTVTHSATSELVIWVCDDVRFAIKGNYDPSALGTLIRSLRRPA